VIGRFCVVLDQNAKGEFCGRVAAIGHVEVDHVQLIIENARTGGLFTVDHSLVELVRDDQNPTYKRLARAEPRLARKKARRR
jgi:hypothetical protein